MRILYYNRSIAPKNAGFIIEPRQLNIREWNWMLADIYSKTRLAKVHKSMKQEWEYIVNIFALPFEEHWGEEIIIGGLGLRDWTSKKYEVIITNDPEVGGREDILHELREGMGYSGIRTVEERNTKFYYVALPDSLRSQNFVAAELDYKYSIYVTEWHDDIYRHIRAIEEGGGRYQHVPSVSKELEIIMAAEVTGPGFVSDFNTLAQAVASENYRRKQAEEEVVQLAKQNLLANRAGKKSQFVGHVSGNGDIYWAEFVKENEKDIKPLDALLPHRPE